MAAHLKEQGKDHSDDLLLINSNAAEGVNSNTWNPNQNASGFKLKITSVKEDGDDFCEFNSVTFDVIEGNPSEQTVCEFLAHKSTSASNIDYNVEVMSGCLVDLNFEYKVGQQISSSACQDADI